MPEARAEKEGACLIGPTPALADAAGTDALLLVYAKDSITAPSMWAVGVLLLPIFLYLAPFFESAARSTRSERVRLADTITLCLVDPRKAETLWFHRALIGTGNLLSASHVERLIGRAHATFTESLGQ